MSVSLTCLFKPKGSASEETPFVADLAENFIRGAMVRSSQYVEPGSYVTLAFEGSSENKEVTLAEVLWVTEVSESCFDMRLRYHKESRLQVLPGLKHLAKVG